jgi:chromosomal replication initiator protein
LEKRLCSRFEWGLIADVQPPDLETRIAILRSKAAYSGMFVPDEILSMIATHIQSNIRELEGALNQVIAMARFADRALTREVAEMALGNLLPRRRELPPSEIIERVARHFGLEISQLTGRSRKRDIVRPRQIAMYLIREETDASLPQIGDILDGRDHSTVLYGCERVAARGDRASPAAARSGPCLLAALGCKGRDPELVWSAPIRPTASCLTAWLLG